MTGSIKSIIGYDVNDMGASSNKIILKNTVFLYGREILSLGISLICTRVLLHQLGVDDFGVYGLIGSVLALFGALRGLFATAVQRFINVEKGRNSNNIDKIFSISILIHAILSLLFVVVVEIVGLLLIPNLNIPEASVSAAYWVFHFSVIASVVTIMIVPFDALIIANERFDAFAGFSIIESVLRLLSVLLLVYSPIPKIIAYSILLFIISLVIGFVNILFCKKTFGKEARLRKVWDATLFKEMSLFAGWQFLGNLAFSLKNTGIDFVLNLFGGIRVNAARAISYQVLNAVLKFTTSISTSFQPQQIMSYAKGDQDRFWYLLILNTKLSYVVTCILGFVFATMAPSLLNIWLDEVPEYTIIFVQTIFLYASIRSIMAPIDTFFKAAGRLKEYQIWQIVSDGISLPVAWLVLYLDFPFFSAYIIMAICSLLDHVGCLFIAKKILNFDITRYSKIIFPRYVISMVLLLLAHFVIYSYWHEAYNWGEFLIKSLVCLAVAIVISILSVFTISEIEKMFLLFREKLLVHKRL